MLKPIRELVLKTRSKKGEGLKLNLGRIEISENQLKADFQIIDKYQSFSSEILRLSLLGIGVYAFLLKDVGDILQIIANTKSAKIFSIISVTSFALAVACTLIHRYYSSDYMAYHIRYLRLEEYLKKPLEKMEEKKEGKVKEERNNESADRNVILQLCEVMIAGAAFFFGLGSICLAISLLTTIFSAPVSK